MKTELSGKLCSLARSGHAALVPFVTCHYPDAYRFDQVVEVVLETGCDLLEIGFPHSDPLADGPTIQRSSHIAHGNGFTPGRGFDSIQHLKAHSDIPIVIMCYANVIYQFGYELFVEKCLDSGVSGVIVPDMIFEEGAELREVCLRRNVSFIPLIAPTTPFDRAAAIAESAEGFVYFVSVTGTTGARSSIGSDAATTVASIKKQSPVPVYTGFGISTPALARQAAKFSDGVIIGSKLIECIDADNGAGGFTTLRSFLTEVRAALP
ncbi:MAG: tryptophan synthase subunit alpha [Candidatus Zixiibacteriota bacterium]